MVECGTCDHRFRLTDEVIVQQKKVYPGERRNASLDRFARVPMSSGVPVNFQTVSYAAEPSSQAFEPTSPLRLVLGLAACLAIVAVALLLMLGGSPGGVLDGTPLAKRLALAAFTAVVTLIMLIGANPRARGKAIVGGGLVGLGLIALPFFFREGEQSLQQADRGPLVLEALPDEAPPEEEDPYAGLKREMSYTPLAKEIERVGESERVAGVWLRDLREVHKFQVRDYLVRATGADPASHMYPRPPDYLMVITGGNADLRELEEICRRFGEVRRIDDLQVVEVRVNNDVFVEGPQDKLTATGTDAFYELNLRELESIDPQRAKRAISRLAGAEPRVYRKDIVNRLQRLLKEGDKDLSGETARALDVWAEEGDGSLEAVRDSAAKFAADGPKEVPEAMVRFLAARRDPSILPVVDALWAGDPTKWEEYYDMMGPLVEETLPVRLDNLSPSLKLSAVRLLGRSGTAKSIPVLEKIRDSAGGELRAAIDVAIQAIRGRG